MAKTIYDWEFEDGSALKVSATLVPFRYLVEVSAVFGEYELHTQEKVWGEDNALDRALSLVRGGEDAWEAV